MTEPFPDHKIYEVVIGFQVVDKAFKQMLREQGWELFPIPVGDGDLPCYGIRAIRAKEERA